MTKWNSNIEDAPRDGRLLIMYKELSDGVDIRRMVYWEENFQDWCDLNWRVDSPGWTHWMDPGRPIPRSPEDL